MSENQDQFSQNNSLLLLHKINSEIGEVQSKLLSLQSRLLEAKQIIIQKELQKNADELVLELDEEIPLPF